MNKSDFHGVDKYAGDLTWREQEILLLLGERLTNREIAERLHLAESTVKDYVGKIIGKLYVKNRREAVERANALGLLDPELQTEVRSTSNLPADTTPFIGRSRELAEIKRSLAETRLLTLTGPGGIGKTRLAIKAAMEVNGGFNDGKFFVNLAPINTVGQIIQTVAETLRFPLATQEDPKRQLLRYLKPRQLLLVMDNYEHLLDGVGIVSEIIQSAHSMKIIATSRERLNLQGETSLVIAGLGYSYQVSPYDIEINDAAALFVQSARKVRPDFTPSDEELGQITEICRFVQGMPLAIELAAGWLTILQVDEIAAEMGKSLDILSTDMRDSPERHRSIRAVFDHSWSLLGQEEQEILMRLSVFRGGFGREAAQRVSGASLQLLAGLINKSFLNHDPDTGRLEIHELLRQCAQEYLRERPEIDVSAHEAHAAYYAEFMQQRWGHLKGSRQMTALAEIDDDIENVRAAWRYYLEQRNVSQMWKFIYCLWHVYWIRWWNHAGMELFAETVRLLQGDVDEHTIALRALAMAFQGYFMGWLDLSNRGYALAKEGVQSLEQLDHPVALAFAYDCLSVNAYFQNRYAEQIESAEKMIEVANRIDDKWLMAFSLFAASMGAMLAEDYPEASRLAKTNLTLCDEIGDVIGSSLPLIVLGHVALAREEHVQAFDYYLRCLKISQKVGFYYSIQTASKYLGKVAITLGKLNEAEIYLRQALKITKEIGFVRDTVNLLFEFARLRATRDDPEEAVELLGLVVQHPASRQFRLLEGVIADSAYDLLSQLEDKPSTKIYASALERGGNLQLDQVVDRLLA